jgi:ribosomal protein S12 methylthiotransferase accessory factor YcaO
VNVTVHDQSLQDVIVANSVGFSKAKAKIGLAGEIYERAASCGRPRCLEYHGRASPAARLMNYPSVS